MFINSHEIASRLDCLILQSCPKGVPTSSVREVLLLSPVQTAVPETSKCQSSDSFNLSVLLSCRCYPQGFLHFG